MVIESDVVLIQDDIFGGMWNLVGAPSNWDPADPGLLCHDILEHEPHPTGSLLEELRAFGAIVYGRGSRWSSYVRGHWAEGLALDLQSFTVKQARRAKQVDPDSTALSVLPPRRSSAPLMCKHSEQFFAQIQTAFTDNCAGFRRDVVHKAFAEQVLPYMRSGFRRARKRYGSGRNLALIFELLKNHLIHRMIDYDETYSEHVGTVFHLKIDLKSHQIEHTRLPRGISHGRR